VKSDRIHPFRIEVAQEVLGDLGERLKNTRFSYQAEGANWALGTDSDYLRELVRYWKDTYDWRKHETSLNQFAHFRTEVDDIGLHFIHERGKGPNPFPIILTHGYPDSFYRFALFPKDISHPPREWAERFFNVQRWTEMARGGHFAPMEEPELFTEDIRTWFRTFRDGN
jgi:pimeloyl-ACP methyl ester carboxylesterase